MSKGYNDSVTPEQRDSAQLTGRGAWLSLLRRRLLGLRAEGYRLRAGADIGQKMVQIDRPLNKAECHDQAGQYQKPFTRKPTIVHRVPGQDRTRGS